jgi:callose synthase
MIALAHMTLQDIVVCILAFMPTGWGMLQVNVLYFFKIIY